MPEKGCVDIATRQRQQFCTLALTDNDVSCVASAVITIAIRLRYDDTTTHSTTTKVIEITICVRFDCDTTTTRLRRKIHMFIFCSRRIARYVVVGSQSQSQSNRNCNHGIREMRTFQVYSHNVQHNYQLHLLYVTRNGC